MKPQPAPLGEAVPTQPDDDVELDYVGSVANAAIVISALHPGEKRLVFCESRRTVEELGEKLRLRGVTTFLSHASLSADERRRAETAFAETRDCVIVSTSTLELGIDVGDLTVSSRWTHHERSPPSSSGSTGPAVGPPVPVTASSSPSTTTGYWPQLHSCCNGPQAGWSLSPPLPSPGI